jgi:hypothetical protein
MIEPPTTLGFPNEKVIRASSDCWHYFCEPTPGVFALIEPYGGSKQGVFVNFYHDSGDLRDRLTAAADGAYFSVVIDCFVGVGDVPDLLTAACHVHDFVQRHKSAA